MMKLSRREALVLAGATAGATALNGCNRVANISYNIAREPIIPPDPKDNEAVAMLNRFGFGPNNDSVKEFNTLGREAWIKNQLNPSDKLPNHLVARLERLEINHLGPWDLRDWKEDAIIAQMQQSSILRATYSPWQLQERMVDFWTNHFNIFAKKGLSVYRKPWDERNVIRAHALGKFPEMIMASAKSTAMLLYLDQQNSTAAHPNENYGRELLELHTLGVKGGYTQQDVMEVARCFTGWSEERGFLKKKGAFLFINEIHDRKEKTVLGHKIPAGRGVEDGEDVVRIVSLHPSTANHITSKLCQYFLGNINHPIQPQLTEIFLKTEGDIKEVMREILNTFPLKTQPVLKRPLDFIVSALRSTDAATDAAGPIQNSLASMGQPLYLWPMPDGFPVETEAWTSSLLARWNFASQLTKNGYGGTSIDPMRLVQSKKSMGGVEIAFRRPQASRDLNQLSNSVTHDSLLAQIALALSSPEFQWR
ncbi:MAG: DUF1800 domain-containing protein [Fimbriimonadaceae bacterium]